MNMTRKTFLGGSLALAGSCLGGRAFGGEPAAVVGATWPGWTPGHFQIHALYTGVAESLFLVFPDGTSMMIDCGDHPACRRGKLAVPILPNPTRHAGEWVSRYVKRVNPRGRDVDYFLLTHYHNDHAGCAQFHAGDAPNGRYKLSGIGQAMEFLRFGKAIDRAWPTFADPLPVPDDFDRGVVRQLREIYPEMQRRGTKVERFLLEQGSEQIRPLHGAAEDFTVRPLCANGRVLMPDGTVRDLYAPFLRGGKVTALNENAMSIGLVFGYGPFRFFTAGDLSDGRVCPDGTAFDAETELAKACGAADVAKVNHHGHHSMSPALVAALRSRVYIACLWDQLHVTRDTMRRMADAASYPGERVYLPGVFTRERRLEDAGEAWLKDVEPTVYGGAHVIVDVPPGGLSYTVSTAAAADESMRVLSTRAFATGENRG